MSKGGVNMIIFDVIVNEQKVDELYPKTTSIRDLLTFIEVQMEKLQSEYGQQVYLNRRYIYKS